jgi:hypothetical protein
VTDRDPALLDYYAYVADWLGVPNATRNAFARWYSREGGPSPFIPGFHAGFAAAAALPDAVLLCIPAIGPKGVAAIRAHARRREASG